MAKKDSLSAESLAAELQATEDDSKTVVMFEGSSRDTGVNLLRSKTGAVDGKENLVVVVAPLLTGTIGGAAVVAPRSVVTGTASVGNVGVVTASLLGTDRAMTASLTTVSA